MQLLKKNVLFEKKEAAPSGSYTSARTELNIPYSQEAYWLSRKPDPLPVRCSATLKESVVNYKVHVVTLIKNITYPHPANACAWLFKNIGIFCLYGLGYNGI